VTGDERRRWVPADRDANQPSAYAIAGYVSGLPHHYACERDRKDRTLGEQAIVQVVGCFVSATIRGGSRMPSFAHGA